MPLEEITMIGRRRFNVLGKLFMCSSDFDTRVNDPACQDERVGTKLLPDQCHRRANIWRLIDLQSHLGLSLPENG